MAPIIIVGSGLAGYNTARMLRRLDAEAPLLIVTNDGGEFYSKPMLSEAFSAGKTPDSIANSTSEQMAAQLKAIVRTHALVTAIEPDAKRVRMGDEALEYSKLVLALGAGQIPLPVTGSAAKRVLTVNNLDDYALFRGTLTGRKSVAVIGAGLIGCEFANDLCSAGFKVDVIDIADQPLPRLLPPAGATMLRERLAAAGVNWHLGSGVKALDAKGDTIEITLDNGTMLTAEVVLSAIGLRPNCGLASAAGLTVSSGIVVDRNLQTSVPDIYALGDCAEVEGLVLPYIMPITHAARSLSATLAGKPTRLTYPAMPVLVKTHACPTIVSPPPSGAAGEWQVMQDPDGVKSLFIDSSGKLLGYALNGKATAERAKLTAQLPPVLA